MFLRDRLEVVLCHNFLLPSALLGLFRIDAVAVLALAFVIRTVKPEPSPPSPPPPLVVYLPALQHLTPLPTLASAKKEGPALG